MLPFTSLLPSFVIMQRRHSQQQQQQQQSGRSSSADNVIGVVSIKGATLDAPSNTEGPFVIRMTTAEETNERNFTLRRLPPVIRSQRLSTPLVRLALPCRQKTFCGQRKSKRLVNSSQLVQALTSDPLMQLDIILGHVGFWDRFDIFSLESMVSCLSPIAQTYFSYGGSSVNLMAEVGMAICQANNLFHDVGISPAVLHACFREIGNNYYRKNPYHTSLHATDVLQAMHCLMSQDSIRSILTPLEKLALILAAVSHDVSHPGVSQAFIVDTPCYILHQLYVIHRNDRSSILEQHHVGIAGSILISCGLMGELEKAAKIGPKGVVYFKDLLKQLILATDIARHKDLLQSFSCALSNREEAFDPSRNQSHRMLLMRILMKSADISNPCRPWRMCSRWSELIVAEFFKQGDVERRLHRPISTNCDRQKNKVAVIQTIFIPNIAEPLFRAVDECFHSPLSKRLLTNLSTNLSRWKLKVAEASNKVSSSTDENAPVGIETAYSGAARILDSDAGESESSRFVSSESLSSSIAISSAISTILSPREATSRNLPDQRLDGDTLQKVETGTMNLGLASIFRGQTGRRKISIPTGLFGTDHQHHMLLDIAKELGSVRPSTSSSSIQSNVTAPRRTSLVISSPSIASRPLGPTPDSGLLRHSEILAEIQPDDFGRGPDSATPDDDLNSELARLATVTGHSLLMPPSVGAGQRRSSDGAILSLPPSSGQNFNRVQLQRGHVQSGRSTATNSRSSSRNRRRASDCPPSGFGYGSHYLYQRPSGHSLLQPISSAATSSTTTGGESSNSRGERSTPAEDERRRLSDGTPAASISCYSFGAEGSAEMPQAVSAIAPFTLYLSQPEEETGGPLTKPKFDGRRRSADPTSTSIRLSPCPHAHLQDMSRSSDPLRHQPPRQRINGWTRTGKRWSDGCLAGPILFSPGQSLALARPIEQQTSSVHEG